MDFQGVFFDNTDYEITKEELGKGTFGTVFLVKNLVDDKYYAAKIIDKRTNFNGNEQMLFMRESLILHDLDHPAIVKFIGINFQSNTDPSLLEPTIITEYLKNGSLKKNLTNPRFTKTKQCIALIGIADAMRYLHQMGILHRDLKSDNILMDDDFYPRVCDFGLSRCFEQSLSNSLKIQMTSAFGTPLYNAPEIFNDEDEYSPGVDVYSFAMIAYEIVTRKTPFFELGKKIGITKLMAEVLIGHRPNFLDFEVTSEMKELISQCWATNPKSRPSFNEIYERLTKDLTIFGDGFDELEVKKYIQLIENERSKENSKVKKDLIVSARKKSQSDKTTSSTTSTTTMKYNPNYKHIDIKKISRNYYQIINLYFSTEVDLNERYVNGIFTFIFSYKSLLHCAADIGNLELVKYLLSTQKFDIKGLDIIFKHNFFLLMMFFYDFFLWNFTFNFVYENILQLACESKNVELAKYILSLNVFDLTARSVSKCNFFIMFLKL